MAGWRQTTGRLGCVVLGLVQCLFRGCACRSICLPPLLPIGLPAALPAGRACLPIDLPIRKQPRLLHWGSGPPALSDACAAVWAVRLCAVWCVVSGAWCVVFCGCAVWLCACCTRAAPVRVHDQVHVCLLLCALMLPARACSAAFRWLCVRGCCMRACTPRACRRITQRTDARGGGERARALTAACARPSSARPPCGASHCSPVPPPASPSGA